MFKPMLAATLHDLSEVRYPVLLSPKLDGVRAIVKGGVVLSRSLKPIPNAHVQCLFGRCGIDGLDGELVIGDPRDADCYRNTVSGVMRRVFRPKVTFHVFDYHLAPEAGFRERLQHAADLAATYTSDRCPLDVLPQRMCRDQAEVEQMETTYLEMGFEGVMLRDPCGTYKFGRSTLKEGGLLKLKRFSDSEAEILGFEERMHNTNEAETNELGRTKRSSAQAGLVPDGTLGALLVRDIHTGVEFSVGTGFDDATRADIWANRHRMLGALVKYKHFAIGAYDKPRFPTFLGFRAPIDL